MKMRSFEWVRALAAPLMLVSLAGCQQGGDDLVRVEPNSLGIAYLQIDHRTADGDRFLEVRGLNDDGEELARATLRTGMVNYPPGSEVMSPGTQLDLSVGETDQAFVNPDREPHENPEPDDPSIAAFTRLAAVSSAIMDEAGIWFRRRDLEGEASYTAATCWGGNHPFNAGFTPSSSQCCQEVQAGEDFVWQKIGEGYGANLNKLAKRGIEANGNACRTSGGATGCGYGSVPFVPCAYGPCGARVLPIGGSTTAATVFTPSGQPGVCGADSNGAAAGGVVETPEPYTSQPLKPGVSNTCPYAACRSDGMSGTTLQLTARCLSTAKGTNTISLGGGNEISCTAAAPFAMKTFWAPIQIPQYVWITAGSGGSGTVVAGCIGSSTNKGGIYGFNETPGSQVAHDSRGNDDYATISGSGAAITSTGCQWGNCLNVSTGYASFDNGTEMNFLAGSSFQVFTYVKTTDTYGAIVSLRSSTSSGPVIDLVVGHDDAETDAGKLMTFVRDGDGGTSGYAHIKGGVVNDNVWHRVEVRRNGTGSGVIELFLDSVSQGTATGTQVAGNLNTNRRRVGQEWYWETNNPGGPYSQLTGLVEDVYVTKDCILYLPWTWGVEVEFSSPL